MRNNIEGTYTVVGDLYTIDCILGASNEGTVVIQKDSESNMSIDIGDGIIITANDFEGVLECEFNIPAQTMNYDGTLLTIEGAGNNNCGVLNSGGSADGIYSEGNLLLAIEFFDNEGTYVYWELGGVKQ